MADDTTKGFVLEWIIVGFLLFALLGFSMTFISNNSSIGLDSYSQEVLNTTNTNLKTSLYEINNDTNNLLNITSKTDPEAGYLGSRDSVATAYGYKKPSVSVWSQLKILIGWIFAGELGKMLLSVIGGMLGFLSLYYIIKFIRTGT